MKHNIRKHHKGSLFLVTRLYALILWGGLFTQHASGQSAVHGPFPYYINGENTVHDNRTSGSLEFQFIQDGNSYRGIGGANLERIVENISRSGTKSLFFSTVAKTGGPRSHYEIDLVNTFTSGERGDRVKIGDERFLAFSFRFDGEFFSTPAGAGFLISQVRMGNVISPVSLIASSSGEIFFRGAGPGRASRALRLYKKDVWYDIIMGWKYNPFESEGYYRVWLKESTEADYQYFAAENLPVGGTSSWQSSMTYGLLQGVRAGMYINNENTVHKMHYDEVCYSDSWIQAAKGKTIPIGNPPVLSFVEPLAAFTTLKHLSNIEVEVESNVSDDQITEMKLYRDGDLVRTQNEPPYQWGKNGQDDNLLRDLPSGKHTFRAVATLLGGGTIESSFFVDVEQPALASGSFDFGSSSSGLESGYTRIHERTLTGNARWTSSLSDLSRTDRGSNGLLNRDLIYSSQPETFAIEVKNGEYEVSVRMGDTFPHDDMIIKAEGQVVASDIDRAADQWADENFSVIVNDGLLELEFSDGGGSDANWVVNGLTFSKINDLIQPIFLDFGSNDSATRNRFSKVTPSSLTGNMRWRDGAGLSHRDRGTDNIFNRDFITSSSPKVFEVDLENGTYHISVLIGDTFRHDDMIIKAEGVTKASNIDRDMYEWDTENFAVTVTDGTLDLEFSDGGGTDPNWVLNGLTLSKVSDLVRQPVLIDFGDANSPTQDGFTKITPSSLSGEMRWRDGVDLGHRDRNTNDLLNRDLVQSSSPKVFEVDLENGTYHVSVLIGDTFRHDDMIIKAEGSTKVSDIDREAGHWATETFEVTVQDGTLDLEFSDGGGSDPNWVVNGLILAMVQDVTEQGTLLDFGTNSSPTQAGYSRITSPSLRDDVRWRNGSELDHRDRATNDNLNRDFIFSASPETLEIDLENGIYRVSVMMGDIFRHDDMLIKAEGLTKASNINRAANQWDAEVFTVTVEDGTLDLEFSDGGGSDANWVVNGVKISTIEIFNTITFTDSDLDSLDDQWEIQYFGSIDREDGTGDADDDGISNIEEMIFGGDPNSGNSGPNSTATIQTSNESQIEFQYRRPKNFENLGITYQIQTSSNLFDDSWSDTTVEEHDITETPDGLSEWVTILLPMSETKKFVRSKAVMNR